MVRSAAEIRTPSARRCFQRAQRVSVVHEGVPKASELAEFPLGIDALLGVGHSAPLRPPYREAVGALRTSAIPILAVDVPSGLEDPDGLVANWTVALSAPKAGVPPERAGETTVREIGIPGAAWQETGPGEFLRLPTSGSAHPSGRGGRVVVVGGGPYAGAPALTGLAALRCGAERATLLVPSEVAPVVQGFSPNLVVRGIGGARFGSEDAVPAAELVRLGSVAAIVVGPGAGSHPGTRAFFEKFLATIDPTVPVVVDADALPAIRTEDGRPWLSGRTVVATPNAGEFARLMAAGGPSPDADGAEGARMLAASTGVTVIRKGAADEISDGVRMARNRNHHSAMAVAGAGDVLDGILAAILALRVDAMGAARLATYWSGAAAQRAGAIRGMGILATDIVEALPEAGRIGLERVRALG
jgi:NAD(P)H-hydrate epimerase